MNYESAIKAASLLIKFSIIEEHQGNAEEARDRMQQAVGAAKILSTVYDKWTEDEEGYDCFGTAWYDMECAAGLHGEEMEERFSL